MEIVSSTATSLPVNAFTSMATTSSPNGTYIWLYNGQQNDLGVTRVALTNNAGASGFASYVPTTFTPSGLPTWNTYLTSMTCQRGTSWYILRYLQAPGAMTYTSFIIDLADDR